jgi:hypothetical protein
MAKKGEFLDTGAAFPRIDLDLAGGESYRLPEDLGAGYGVVLLYRGSW